MIDKRMYRETFSQLRASDQAKQEVLQKMQEMKQRKRMPRVLRGAALAAAMVMALAVTAGAVNVATDGALFRQFTIVWTSGDQYLARDDQGNAVSITLVDGDVVTEEDGRWRPRASMITPTTWRWSGRTAAGRPAPSPSK